MSVPIDRRRLQELPNDLTDQLVQKIMSLDSSYPKVAYLQKHLMSKYVSDLTDPAPLRRSRAIEKWLTTEAKNEVTTERLLSTHEEYQLLPRVSFGAFVDRCRSIIRDIIGDVPPYEALIGQFTGGASTSRSRTTSHPGSKYVGDVHITARALPVWTDLVSELPGWIGFDEPWALKPVIVKGNVLFTVPKNTDIDRVACKEPDLNMFMQRGLGLHLGACLRKVGINLTDQSKNRRLAQIGSLTGELSTLDLSSASDSVSEGLVALLLPECWHTLLDSVRSQVTIIDGHEHRNQMFSSMGNGFTFELESLLFYSLMKTTAYFRGEPGVLSVYGDDIICPSGLSYYLTWVLKYFGFSVNSEKSFTSGPIRESCGGHYYNGLDITPFYIRKPIVSMVDLIHVANQLRQWSSIEQYAICDPMVEPIWLWLKHMVPVCLWGGGDTSFKYQLTSYDASSHRLYQESRKKTAGLGGYFHWLNATWDRKQSSDGVSTSEISIINPSRERLRKVREQAVPRLTHLFLHEIDVSPSQRRG